MPICPDSIIPGNSWSEIESEVQNLKLYHLSYVPMTHLLHPLTECNLFEQQGNVTNKYQYNT